MINKIKGVGLDTTKIDYKVYPGYCKEEFYYIDIRSNNSFLLPEILKDSNIIVGSNFIKGLKSTLEGLLFEVGRSEIEVLLISTEAMIEENQDELKDILDSGLVGCIGIKHPKDLEHLIDMTEKLKKVVIPKYISLDISPIHFQKDILDWAEQNNIGILGFNPLGGKFNSENAIQSFTLSFLLNFSARYSDVVFLSGGDITKSYDNSEYLKDLIGKESSSIYDLDAPVNQLQKPYNKICWVGIKVGNIILPYENPGSLINSEDYKIQFDPLPEINLEELKKPIEENRIRKIMENVYSYSYINSIGDFPETKNKSDYLAFIRYRLLSEIKKALDETWKIEMAKISNEILVIQVSKILEKKKFIGKDKKVRITHNFILSITEKGEPIFFCPDNENAEN